MWVVSCVVVEECGLSLRESSYGEGKTRATMSESSGGIVVKNTVREPSFSRPLQVKVLHMSARGWI